MADKPEKQKSIGTNDVDVSPEKVEQEWQEIAIDEGIDLLSPETSSEDSPEPVQERPGNLDERCIGLLAVLMSIGFPVLLPSWQVVKEEVGALAVAWGRVLSKYIPVGWARYLPDVGGGDGSECIELDALVTTIQFIESHTQGENQKPESQPEKPEPVFRKTKERPGQNVMRTVHEFGEGQVNA